MMDRIAQRYTWWLASSARASFYAAWRLRVRGVSALALGGLAAPLGLIRGDAGGGELWLTPPKSSKTIDYLHPPAPSYPQETRPGEPSAHPALQELQEPEEVATMSSQELEGWIEDWGRLLHTAQELAQTGDARSAPQRAALHRALAQCYQALSQEEGLAAYHPFFQHAYACLAQEGEPAIWPDLLAKGLEIAHEVAHRADHFELKLPPPAEPAQLAPPR